MNDLATIAGPPSYPPPQPSPIDWLNDWLLRFEGEDTTDDDALTLISARAQVKELAKLLDDRASKALIAHMKRTGRDLRSGTVRWYLGSSKSVKCKDRKLALRAILDASGGDIFALDDYLSSDPFKQGECRKLLGEKWSDSFEVKVDDELKQGVCKIDEAWLPKPQQKEIADA